MRKGRDPTWIEDGKVVACAYPRDEAEWKQLQALGVTVLVNLHEEPHSSEVLAQHGMTSVHIPVPDFSAPTPEQLEQGTAAIRTAVGGGRVVAAHCGAGLGRTGTLVACRLLDAGLAASPQQAIARVREARPGSVETGAQEQAVAQFAAKQK